MIIDTTNDELLINGQRWQRGGYLLATAYATDQINITARDGRVIGKAIEWDRILDKDKNTFGLDRDGTVTALTNIFNSQVKSPYKIDALRDVENGTAAYGEIMIYRSPGEWQYEVLEQYHGAYDSEAATLRSGATATLELYYTAQADGDGISELSQSNTPASGYQIIRKLYYAERAQQDPDTGTWVQFADLAANTSFNDAKTALLAYLKERTGGTVPISLKMTWEEVEIYNGLLDSYGGAAAAYSVRRLSSAYTGPLIEVQRASDSTTQDIGYDANGDLDTAAIATFCSGTTCGVRVWYDQSGNGNDATQTTFANQPTIYTGGAVVTENGEPALDFDGSNDVLNLPFSQGANTGFLIASICTPDLLQLSSIIDFRDANNDGIRITYASSGSAIVSTSSDDASVAYTANQHIIIGQYDGSNLAAYVNGISGGAVSGSSTNASTNGKIGGRSYSSGEFFNGTIQESIIYTSDQTSNRTGIETNVNDYFGIYTPFTTGLLDDYGGAAAAYSLRRLSSTYTGDAIRVRRASDNAEQDIGFDIEGNLNTAALASFCSGTDGFVKTWYDQSGNGNDATQTTTANQPKIYDSATGVVTENGKPAVYSSGGKNLNTGLVALGTSGDIALDFFAVINNSSTNDAVLFALGDNTNLNDRRRILSYRNDSSTQKSVRLYGGYTVVDSTATGQVLFNTNYSGGGGAFDVRFDGASATLDSFSNTGLNVQSNSGFALFGPSSSVTPEITTTSNDSIGYIQEAVFYLSDQSSNRTGIESNINTFYSIY